MQSEYTSPILAGSIWKLKGSTQEVCIMSSIVDEKGNWRIEYVDLNGKYTTMTFSQDEWLAIAEYIGVFNE